MGRFTRAGLVLMPTVFVATAAALGQAPDGDPVDERLEAMERSVNGLRQENAAMQAEIGELRGRLGENWLTEQRAEEIRGLVADVLADADTRASALSQGMTAGWSEHFFLASPDGRFKLQLAGQLQFRYVWSFHDETDGITTEPDKYRSGFENTRTKLIFSGHVFGPDLTYRVEGNYARNGGDLELQDAWIRYQLSDHWSVRFGQFKLPFNREELVDSSEQLLVERSLISESQNIGRSQGLELTYSADLWRAALAVSDAGDDNIGGFNLAGTHPANTVWSDVDTEYAVTGRFEYLVAGSWRQFDDLTSPTGDPFGLLVGVAGHAQRGESTGAPSTAPEVEWYKMAADVSVEWGGANALFSFTYDRVNNGNLAGGNPVDIYGFVLQGGVYFTPKFEAYARFEYGILDLIDTNFDDLVVLTLGGNYYFEGHDAKLTADIGFGINRVDSPWDSDIAGWRRDGEDQNPQVVIRSQFQLRF